MMVLDANYILRYLLADNEKMYPIAKATIQNEYGLLLNEVIAEVVYVLSGVYEVPKTEIAEKLTGLIMLENLTMHEDKRYIVKALQIYQSKNLDFVDCCLCALGEKYQVKTFDKKLNRCLCN